MNTRERFQATTAAEMSQVLLAVRTCPDRGSVLSHTVQPECGCAELTACHAGLGRGRAGVGAGAVSLEECVRCRFTMLAAIREERTP